MMQPVEVEKVVEHRATNWMILVFFCFLLNFLVSSWAMSTDRIGTKAENLNGSERKSTEAMLELSTNLKRKNRRRAIDSIFICRLENPIVEPSFWPEIPGIVSPDGKPFAQEANVIFVMVVDTVSKNFGSSVGFLLGGHVLIIAAGRMIRLRVNALNLPRILVEDTLYYGPCLFKHMVVEHLHDHILIRGRKTKKSEESQDFPGREQIQFGDAVQAPPKLTAPSKIY
ncbi:hypothetical protein NC652_032735 [Populus alba x Populus x berolinensis]|nr:hypothetical protein NC652_032729 [Populus alba x Populus x berolinensis]KAJ6879253.1 hypothetical protein NC652_032735 [Populus alba x Populus x berolinensis]